MSFSDCCGRKPDAAVLDEEQTAVETQLVAYSSKTIGSGSAVSMQISIDNPRFDSVSSRSHQEREVGMQTYPPPGSGYVVNHSGRSRSQTQTKRRETYRESPYSPCRQPSTQIEDRFSTSVAGFDDLKETMRFVGSFSLSRERASGVLIAKFVCKQWKRIMASRLAIELGPDNKRTPTPKRSKYDKDVLCHSQMTDDTGGFQVINGRATAHQQKSFKYIKDNNRSTSKMFYYKVENQFGDSITIREWARKLSESSSAGSTARSDFSRVLEVRSLIKMKILE